MREREPPLLPPRRRNWKPGKHQIGLFVRSPSGAVLESVWDDASPAVQRLVKKLLGAK